MIAAGGWQLETGFWRLATGFWQIRFKIMTCSQKEKYGMLMLFFIML